MDTATQVGVSLGELATVAVAIVGVLWALGKLNMRQFSDSIDEKFKSGRSRIDTLEASITAKFVTSDQRIDSQFATIDTKLKSFDPLHGELARVDKDLIQVRLEMSQNYVRQEGIRVLTTRMEQLFREVFDKLDSKADKSECDKVHRQ